MGTSIHSFGDGKSSSYLSAGVPMIKEEGSVASDYSRITPASEECTVTHLGSVSVSVNGVQDVLRDGSEQTLPLGAKSVPLGAKSAALAPGSNSRRPLWMQLEASGSVRSLLQSKNGRSKSRQLNSDSGAASHSDALTRSIVPGRSKYLADFPMGSPAKALLKNQDGCEGEGKLTPVSGSWNCESELDGGLQGVRPSSCLLFVPSLALLHQKRTTLVYVSYSCPVQSDMDDVYYYAGDGLPCQDCRLIV
jgi:hypothetical protein